MTKTQENKIRVWINRLANGAKSKEAAHYKERNPKVKTLKEAKEKIQDKVTFYAFYNEEDNKTVYTDGYICLVIRGKIEGIPYYEGTDIKSFDYKYIIKDLSNITDCNRQELSLPKAADIRNCLKAGKEYFKNEKVIYHFGDGDNYPAVQMKYLLCMTECVNQDAAVTRLVYGKAYSPVITEDNNCLAILMPIRKKANMPKTNLHKFDAERMGL